MADATLATVPDPEREPERKPLPEIVKLDLSEGMPPHSPIELELLEQQTGRTFEKLTGEEASGADRERALIWLRLRRLGYEPTWQEVGTILIDYVMPDPLGGESSRPSQPSATGTA
jgi:hypothetical protein